MSLFQESKHGPRLEIECNFLILMGGFLLEQGGKKGYKYYNGEMLTVFYGSGIKQGYLLAHLLSIVPGFHSVFGQDKKKPSSR